MLQTSIKVIDFGDTHSKEAILKRLNTLGYLRNTKIHPKQKTIYFEYASFRDMDAASMELRKMGVFFKIAKDREVGKKSKTLIRTNSSHD